MYVYTLYVQMYIHTAQSVHNEEVVAGDKLPTGKTLLR